MPRRKPTQIIEHRLSLSDYERSALKEYLLERQRIDRLNAASRGVASVGAVASSGIALWILAGYLAFDIVPDVVNKFIDSVTVWQRKCPGAIEGLDKRIATAQGICNGAQTQNDGSAGAMAREANCQKILQKLKDRRAAMAEFCEWVTIGQEYTDSGEPISKTFIEIWSRMWPRSGSTYSWI